MNAHNPNFFHPHAPYQKNDEFTYFNDCFQEDHFHVIKLLGSSQKNLQDDQKILYIPKAVQKLVFDGVGLLLPLNLPASPSLLGLAASAAAAPGLNARHLLVKFPTFELPWVYQGNKLENSGF
jgi:hypothetical protein